MQTSMEPISRKIGPKNSQRAIAITLIETATIAASAKKSKGGTGLSDADRLQAVAKAADL